MNSQELFALERVALAQQAILRAARLESGFFTNCLNEFFDTNAEPTLPMNSELTADIEVTKAQNRNYVLGHSFHRFARQSNSFALLLRYQAQAERQYRRAIEEFDRLKAQRAELPNEPIFAEPDQTETAGTPPETETKPISPETPAPAPAPEPHPLEPVAPRVQQYGSFTMGLPEMPQNAPSVPELSYGKS